MLPKSKSKRGNKLNFSNEAGVQENDESLIEIKVFHAKVFAREIVKSCARIQCIPTSQLSCQAFIIISVAINLPLFLLAFPQTFFNHQHSGQKGCD